MFRCQIWRMVKILACQVQYSFQINAERFYVLVLEGNLIYSRWVLLFILIFHIFSTFCSFQGVEYPGLILQCHQCISGKLSAWKLSFCKHLSSSVQSYALDLAAVSPGGQGGQTVHPGQQGQACLVPLPAGAAWNWLCSKKQYCHSS